ncbi:MAG: hypothetical protein IPG16_03215 [Comamonadaceae bacterium]|nr:hypothetical protein [Comamonadaceae bacterium]
MDTPLDAAVPKAALVASRPSSPVPVRLARAVPAKLPKLVAPVTRPDRLPMPPSTLEPLPVAALAAVAKPLPRMLAPILTINGRIVIWYSTSSTADLSVWPMRLKALLPLSQTFVQVSRAVLSMLAKTCDQPAPSFSRRSLVLITPIRRWRASISFCTLS